MLVKGIITEDFVNYKEPCMTIEFPFCNFKCDKENGTQLCQNYSLQFDNNIDISYERIAELYTSNDITKAIVFQGLEPYFDRKVLYELIDVLRNKTDDPIIIYTGFTEDELNNDIPILKFFRNIIVKFGRYRPNNKPHYYEILGVNLASDNQYAKKL